MKTLRKPIVIHIGNCIVNLFVNLVLMAMLVGAASAQTSETKVEWNRFRGPNGSGVHLMSKAPLEWSNDKNVRWKCPLPGYGESSPVVSGDRVFVTAHSLEPIVNKGFDKYLLCIDLNTGAVIWKKQIPLVEGKKTVPHDPVWARGGFAAHTPVVSGNSIFAYFGRDGLFAFDFNGAIKWHLPTGGSRHHFGSGASPIVHRNLVIINAGVECNKLFAVDKQTGKVVWEFEDKLLNNSYSTPITYTENGNDQLVVCLCGKLISLLPDSGKLKWSFDYGEGVYFQAPSPVALSSGVGCWTNLGFISLSPGKSSGPSKLLWQRKVNPNYGAGTPIVAEGRIIFAGSSNSIVTTVDQSSGEIVDKHRVPGGKDYKASPVRLGNYLLLLATDGSCTLWDARKLLSSAPSVVQNILTEDDPNFVATPAITKNEILIRSDRFLYSISKAPKSNQATIVANNNERKLNLVKESRLLAAKKLVNEAIPFITVTKLESSESKLIEALEIRRDILEPSHPSIAEIFHGLGHVYFLQREFKKALSSYKRAYEGYRDSLSDEHPRSVITKLDLAVLYFEMGRKEDAGLLIADVLEVSKRNFETAKTRDNDNNSVAFSLNDKIKTELARTYGVLARHYGELADYGRQIPLYRRRIELLLSVSDAESDLRPTLRETASELGLSYVKIGNYFKAETIFKRIKDELEKKGNQPEEFGNCLHNLADLYKTMGKHKDAEKFFIEAIGVKEKSFGRDHLSIATSLDGLAHLNSIQGNLSAALPLCRRSLEIKREHLGPDHTSTADTLGLLATVFHKQGNYSSALQLYHDVLDVFKTSHGENHPKTALAMTNLAKTLVAQGEHKQAVSYFNRARRSAAKHVDLVLPSLSGEWQQTFLDQKYKPDLALALSFSSQFGSLQQEVIGASAEWIANGKSVGQQALARQNLLTRDAKDPQTAALVQDLTAVRNRLAKLAMSADTANPKLDNQALAKELVNEEDRLSQQLNATKIQYLSTYQWVKQETISNTLGPNTALIDIGRVQDYNFRAIEKERSWGTERYIAWITHSVNHGKVVRAVDLGPAKQIDALIEQVRNEIQNSKALSGTQGNEGLKSKLKSLAKLAWQPIEQSLTGVENVVLSPDGMLWLVPWSALPIDNELDNSKFLIEKYNLRLVNSARDVLSVRDGRATKRPVVFANPSFDQRLVQKQASIRRLFDKAPEKSAASKDGVNAKSRLPKVQPLPNTGIEANAIKPNILAYASSRPVVYREGFALEHAVKKLESPKVAAFATHGFFLGTLEDDEKNNSIGNGNLRSSPLNENNTPLKNPLLRCGLLFAGCNDHDSVVGDDDGILTGLEITGIEFRGTELVVLSACDTGVGDIQNGEGVAGLRQAFQLAGAESVLASLWQVDDAETARLMNLFFDNLAKGMTKSESLRQAQLTRIKARRARHGAAHPFFWAAFTLTGQD